MSHPGDVDLILAECREQGVTDERQQAYILATTEHETGGTFKPVREAAFLRNPLKYLKNLRYFPFYGRGYVQLTWRANYAKYQSILGLPLIQQPDLVLRPDVAAFILVHGMRTGAFTGRDLTAFIHGEHCDWVGARRIVNGTDRAERIAHLARRWLALLRAA